eukprot:6179678-Pleurochrysis_carterae.AAC.4
MTGISKLSAAHLSTDSTLDSMVLTNCSFSLDPASPSALRTHRPGLQIWPQPLSQLTWLTGDSLSPASWGAAERSSKCTRQHCRCQIGSRGEQSSLTDGSHLPDEWW